MDTGYKHDICKDVYSREDYMYLKMSVQIVVQVEELVFDRKLLSSVLWQQGVALRKKLL